MERSRPTMKDVAIAARVSLKTVSRVVNGEPGVTPDTELRVREAIETLRFLRNNSARMLRSGQAGAVGLVVEDIGDPFYSTLSRGMEHVMRARGSLLLSGSSEADGTVERKLALAFCEGRVDGLIVVPTSADHSYLLPEMRAGLPVVFADRPPGRIDADTVLSDNVGGSRQATAHLLAGGHRRIGYLGDNPDILYRTGTVQGIPRGDERCGRARRGVLGREGVDDHRWAGRTWRPRCRPTGRTRCRPTRPRRPMPIRTASRWCASGPRVQRRQPPVGRGHLPERGQLLQEPGVLRDRRGAARVADRHRRVTGGVPGRVPGVQHAVPVDGRRDRHRRRLRQRLHDLHRARRGRLHRQRHRLPALRAARRRVLGTQRAHGDFMWRQFYNICRAGVQGIYISMFDEYGEGNQIAKTAATQAGVPAGSGLLSVDQDGTACSSDYYLRLTNDGGRMLKGQIALTATRPTQPAVSGGGTPGTVVSFRAMANNMIVTADNAGASPLIANRTAIGTREQFTLITDS